MARYRLTNSVALQANILNLNNAYGYDGIDNNHVVPLAGRSVLFYAHDAILAPGIGGRNRARHRDDAAPGRRRTTQGSGGKKLDRHSSVDARGQVG
jgi:hypothetical protein